MLIGLPDLAKERKLSKIMIKMEDYQIFNIPYLFLSKGDILHLFTNLINLKLIVELVSSDKTVFLCFNATQI